MASSFDMRTVTALLRCTSCRFAVYYFLPFFSAFTHVRAMNVYWIVLGGAYWSLHTMGTEAVNRLSDRTEDAVNRRERTALCEQVGFTRLRQLSLGVWTAVAVLDMIALISSRSAVLAILLLLSGLSGVMYSFGLRIARNRFLAPLFLSFHFGGTFSVGWVAASHGLDTTAWRHFVSDGLPFGVVSCATLIGLSGVKDITDVAGDESIGYRSLWVALARKHRQWLSWVLISITFVLTTVFVIARIYPPRFLTSLALIPIAVLLCTSIMRASNAAENSATREFFYQYWMLYLAVTVALYTPNPATFTVVGCALVYWVVTTQYLHWTGGVRRPDLTAIARLVRSYRAPSPHVTVRSSR